MKQSSTKDMILLLLKKNKSLTIAELAEKVAISEIAVRKHIHFLEHNNLVKARVVRQPIGRPVNYYELSVKGQEAFTNHYESFSVELLNDIEKLYGKTMVYELFNHRSERIEEEYKRHMTSESFQARVEELAEIQEQKGYMVELEKQNDKAYTLKQYNCPIWNIAQHYKSICGHEVKLFSDVLADSDVRAEKTMISGEACCTFQITQKSQ
ncbi:helix-turn-helix transcriptional regulator [Halobacillus sp. MO56]